MTLTKLITTNNISLIMAQKVWKHDIITDTTIKSPRYKTYP